MSDLSRAIQRYEHAIRIQSLRFACGSTPRFVYGDACLKGSPIMTSVVLGDGERLISPSIDRGVLRRI